MTTTPHPATGDDRDATSPDRYVRPVATDRWFNGTVQWLTRRGLSLMGSRVLTVTGRRSGLPRSTPVNLLALEGDRFLVAPRGVTEWVRNVRVCGEAELRVGRRVERVTLTELPEAERPPVLRVYLRRWGWEVGRFVDGLTKDSTDAELVAAAPGFPVFRVDQRP